MKNLSVAVIGAGYFAGFHIEAWKRLDGVTLAGIVDRDLKRAVAHGPPAFDSVGEMLQTIAPDIVDIATPPESHADLIDHALRHRPLAVICQKPFCGGDVEAATRLAREAGAAGVPLIVHENFRFQPWYRRMKREIDAGRIGRVLNLTFRLRTGDGQGAEAYLTRQPYFQEMPRFLMHETGIHWVDTFRYLLGEPDAVQADLRRLNPHIRGEDAGHFLFTYRDGRRALFDGNRLIDHAAENCRTTLGEALLEGTEGEIRLAGDGALSIRARGEGEFSPLAPAPEAKDFGGGCVEALQAHVLAALRDGAPLENTAAEYVRNLEIVEAIYRAAESGQRQSLRPKRDAGSAP